MTVELLWGLYRGQLVALEGWLEAWRERHFQGAGAFEATLLAKLVLRLYEDARHAFAVCEVFHDEGACPPAEFRDQFLRVLPLTAAACDVAERYGGGVRLVIQVQEAIGRVYRQGLG